MADYIEKMMRTAGVEPILGCNRSEYYECGTYRPDEIFRETCNECQYVNDKYPNFSPAKLLEIIKLIVIEQILEINTFTRKYKLEYLIFAHNNKSVSNPDFTQALAQLTTELMKAGELDKQKVKEILQG